MVLGSISEGGLVENIGREKYWEYKEPEKKRYREEWIRKLGHITEEECEKHAEINAQLAARRAKEEAFERINFVKQLLVICEELAKEPIMVPTGQKRMVKRKQPHITYLTHESEKITHPRVAITHPRRSEQDMVGEMARVLKTLPLYTARVMSTTQAGLEEHTIRTLKPEKGLQGNALEERIARIQEQNIRDGYLRKRETVEEEMRTRHEHYQKPPEEPPVSRRPRLEPPHRQGVVPPPEEDEPPVTRRQRN